MWLILVMLNFWSACGHFAFRIFHCIAKKSKTKIQKICWNLTVFSFDDGRAVAAPIAAMSRRFGATA